MSKADIIVKAYFFEHGQQAPKYSEFPGIVTGDTMFGGSGSWVNYTSRKDSIKNSMDDEELGSFTGYTGRESATKDSAEKYFTMTDSRKLYSDADRKVWSDECKKYFDKSGDIAWTMVISLKDKDMLRQYGLRDQRDFADATNVAMRKVFKHLHLNPDNMIWWEDYHSNTDHPHMHITFLEKEQNRSRGKLKPKELDMIKTVFTTEFIARKKLVDTYGMTSEEALKNVREHRTKIVTNKDKLPREILENVFILYSQLPEKGRLQYNSSMMIPFRNQLDDIVNDILLTEGMKKEYAEFTTVLEILENTINDANNGEISTIRQSEDQKLRVQIANSILKNFKNLDEYTAEQFRMWKQNHLNDVIDEERMNGVDTEFEEAAEMLSPDSSGEEKADGLSKMKEAAEKGNKSAQHVMNYMKHHNGFNKRASHVASRAFSTNVSKDVRRAISDKVFAIRNEINAYLQNDDHLVPQTIEDQVASKYLEGRKQS